MTAQEDPPVDASLLTRIASIETKIRTMCDLIPVSAWGFSSDVHEKLRQRKHRIVNQQLTAKEKKSLTNSRKQQVARTVGGVCRHVSEVIDLLATSSAQNAQPKKVKLNSQPQNEKKNDNASVDSKDKSRKQEQKTPAVTKKVEERSSEDDSDSDDACEPTETLTQKKSTNAAKEVASSSKGSQNIDDADEHDTTDEEVENAPKVKASKRPASTSEEVQAKKPKFSVESVKCASKDQSLDVLEQRELAIRKLQEKLQNMKASRQGKKKRLTDPSTALEFEQERKLKRRMSKMKMKQRRSEQKRQKTDGKSTRCFSIKTENKQDLPKDEAVSYSKFDFLVKAEGKKKRLTTSQKKNKFTGKDYKSLLNKASSYNIRCTDNVELLKKGLKRKEHLKEKRKENWLNREKNVEREKAKKQDKRKGNLQKRMDDKKKNKLKVMRKKGRIQ
ncbi:surfeit locus protein 6 [Oesophagostomum dentatum]|uniref:Surfeit locus protein 6 n=1 Tax=Oesophagostomum dentatum TaxID=61180 RepID=A0A0B1TKB2_OESDE|nr:surfeit locus protein 6 [Oesophagostomum dentatum]